MAWASVALVAGVDRPGVRFVRGVVRTEVELVANAAWDRSGWRWT